MKTAKKEIRQKVEKEVPHQFLIRNLSLKRSLELRKKELYNFHHLNLILMYLANITNSLNVEFFLKMEKKNSKVASEIER